MPLPNPYTELDLKVWTHEKTWVQGGSEVTVILDASDIGNNCSYWMKYISAKTSMPDSFRVNFDNTHCTHDNFGRLHSNDTSIPRVLFRVGGSLAFQ